MTRRYRSKAKLRSYARRISFFAVLLSLVFLLTYPYLRSAFLKLTIPIGRGTRGSLDERVAGQAVFAGGVECVLAPAPGTLQLLVSDGESVRTGQVIAEVGVKGAKEAFNDSLEYAKAQLAAYEAETEDEFRELSKALQGSYARAVSLFFESRASAGRGAVDLSYEYEAMLEAEEQSLREKASRLAMIEEERARLSRAVAAIEAAQASSVVKVLAPCSGVFSTEITAVDSKFTVESVSGKTAPELATLAREAREARPGTVKSGQVVKTGDIVGRVVSGQGVSFFLPVKTEDKPDVKQSGRVDVGFDDGSTIPAMIAKIVDGSPPGYSIIVGEITVMPTSKVVKAADIGITVRTSSGIVIPKSAILEIDGRKGVLSVQKTYARFQEVDVLMVKGDKAVVKGISETDEVVLKAMRFLEGKRVR